MSWLVEEFAENVARGSEHGGGALHRWWEPGDNISHRRTSAPQVGEGLGHTVWARGQLCQVSLPPAHSSPYPPFSQAGISDKCWWKEEFGFCSDAFWFFAPLVAVAQILARYTQIWSGQGWILTWNKIEMKWRKSHFLNLVELRYNKVWKSSSGEWNCYYDCLKSSIHLL